MAYGYQCLQMISTVEAWLIMSISRPPCILSWGRSLTLLPHARLLEIYGWRAWLWHSFVKLFQIRSIYPQLWRPLFSRSHLPCSASFWSSWTPKTSYWGHQWCYLLIFWPSTRTYQSLLAGFGAVRQWMRKTSYSLSSFSQRYRTSAVSLKWA